MLYLLVTSVIGIIIHNSQAAELFDSEKKVNLLIPNVSGNPQENEALLTGGSTSLNEAHESNRNDISSQNTFNSNEPSENGNDKITQYQLINVPNGMPGTLEQKKPVDQDKAPKTFLKSFELSLQAQPKLALNGSDSTLRLINRDLDTFYDNELIMKINNDNNLPENIHIDSTNGDSTLICKEPNWDAYLDRINKRESDKYGLSNHNNYYGNNGGGASIKETFSNIKKNFQHKSKNNTDCGVVRTVSNNTGKVPSQEVEKDIFKEGEPSLQLRGKETMGDGSFSELIDHGENKSCSVTSGLAHHEMKYEGHEPMEEWFEEFSKIDHKEDSGIIGEPKSNNIYFQSRGRCEQGNCLPSGGLPKYQSLQFSPKRNDSYYDKVIKGDLIDKLLKSVHEKVSRNSRMRNEFGIIPAEIRDVRELYNRIRAKDTLCCKKVIEELECFLNWILTVDNSRRKRASEEAPADNSEVLTESCSSKMGFCEDYANDHIPSPEYKKLQETVEKYRESSDNSWNYDSFNLIPDSSKK